MSRRFVGAALVAVSLSGCEEALNNLQFREDLATALSTSGALDGAGPAGATAPVALLLLPNQGSLAAGGVGGAGFSASLSGIGAASYEGAIGVQIIYTGTGGSETFTGVVGWEGFNQTAGTVDEVVVASAITGTATPANSSNFANPGSYGYYWTRSPAADYVATSGSFSVTPSFSGASTDCTALMGQGAVTSCSYQTGTMSGNFAFGAQRVGATGTYNQTAINFAGLPAVKITIVE